MQRARRARRARVPVVKCLHLQDVGALVEELLQGAQVGGVFVGFSCKGGEEGGGGGGGGGGGCGGSSRVIGEEEGGKVESGLLLKKS